MAKKMNYILGFCAINSSIIKNKNIIRYNFYLKVEIILRFQLPKFQK